MNTIRLTVTSDLKSALDYLRMAEYPTLTDAEIFKVAVGVKVADSKRKIATKPRYRDNDLSLKETLLMAVRSFELEDSDGEEKFWSENKVKPLKLKNYV